MVIDRTSFTNSSTAFYFEPAPYKCKPLYDANGFPFCYADNSEVECQTDKQRTHCCGSVTAEIASSQNVCFDPLMNSIAQ